MKIWVDADACPKPVKLILYRAAQRTGVPLILVANQHLQLPASPHIRLLRVASGFDVADRRIVAELSAGDVVVTADIPLAAEVVAKGALALDPRGELYTANNVRARLSMRDFMAGLRDSGLHTGGHAAYSQADRQAFANQLDRLLAQARRPDAQASRCR